MDTEDRQQTHNRLTLWPRERRHNLLTHTWPPQTTDGATRATRPSRGPWANHPGAHFSRAHPLRLGHSCTHAQGRPRTRDTEKVHTHSAARTNPQHGSQARTRGTIPCSDGAGTPRRPPKCLRRPPGPKPQAPQAPRTEDPLRLTRPSARRPGCSRQVERWGVPAAAAPG